MPWHVFISHASEDKESVARPLALALQALGMEVWLDDFELTLGDSLRRSIDRGLSSSKFGVVILSRDFFSKEWPNRELDGLAAREDGKEKVILPIWHGVSREDVVAFSPPLADRLAVSTTQGLEVVARKVFEAVTRQAAREQPAPGGVHVDGQQSLRSIRQRLLNAGDDRGMRLLLSEIEAFLHHSPYDPEARELKRTVESALRPRMPPAMPAAARPSRWIPIAAALSVATLITSVLVWQHEPRSKPAASLPSSVEPKKPVEILRSQTPCRWVWIYLGRYSNTKQIYELPPAFNFLPGRTFGPPYPNIGEEIVLKKEVTMIVTGFGSSQQSKRCDRLLEPPWGYNPSTAQSYEAGSVPANTQVVVNRVQLMPNNTAEPIYVWALVGAK